jgi:hypothetical protein
VCAPGVWDSRVAGVCACRAIRGQLLLLLLRSDTDAAPSLERPPIQPFQFDHEQGKVVTVGYATADGTATAPADYTATSGTLTFAPGETAKTVTVAVVGDTLVEGDETFSLVLSGPVNATLGAGQEQATATIADDDGKVRRERRLGRAGPAVRAPPPLC